MNNSVASQAIRRVLIIKLSALGDVVLALGPMAAIRQQHPDAHITVLTTRPYGPLLSVSGYVDEVWLDERPKWHQFAKCMELRRRLRGGRFDVVYDLQTSSRSNAYFRLLHGYNEPLWSGIARGCSHPHKNPQRDYVHTIERQAEQLYDAGINEVPFPNLDWLQADVSRFDLSSPYALLVPGGAPHRPGKRWPAERYADLAKDLTTRGVQPVLLGTAAESDILDHITRACPGTKNLCDMTDIADIAVLGRDAMVAVGNDTGPMHVLAVSGSPCVVLYSHESAPTLCAQRGPAVEILRRKVLERLSVEDVLAVLTKVTKSGAEDLAVSSA